MGLRRGCPLGRHTAFLAVCTITAAMCAAYADRAPAARAGGVGENGLQLTVTVNTRPGLGAVQPGIRAGAPVVKVYRLTNRSGADLSSVRLTDPAVAPALLRCGGGSGSPGTLRALSSTTCTARFPAAPGPHTGWVTATGAIASLGIRMKAVAHSGYAGVAGQLSLSESALLTSFNEAEVRYVLTNPGNRTVYDVRLADPALAPGRIDCSGRTNVPDLPPGTSVTCAAQVVRPPGTYRSAGVATGSDRTITLGPAGGGEAPPVLTAHASLSFSVPTPPILPPAALAPPFPFRPAFPLQPRPPLRQQAPPSTGPGTVSPPGSPGAPGAPGTPGSPGSPGAGGAGTPGAASGAGGASGPGGAPGSAVAPVPAVPPPAGGLPGQPPGPATRGLLAQPPFYSAPIAPPGPPGPFAPGETPAAPLFGEGAVGTGPAPANGGTAGAVPVAPGAGAGGAGAGGAGVEQPGGGAAGVAPAAPGGGVAGAPGGGVAGAPGGGAPGVAPGGGVAGVAPAPPAAGTGGVAPAVPGGGTAGAAPVAPGGGGAAGIAPAPPGGGIAGAAPAQPGGGTAGVTPPRPPAPVVPPRPRPPRTNERPGEEASVLTRVRRRAREVSGLSVVAVLLLLLIPAALAAALMGSRRP